MIVYSSDGVLLEEGMAVVVEDLPCGVLGVAVPGFEGLIVSTDSNERYPEGVVNLRHTDTQGMHTVTADRIRMRYRLKQKDLDTAAFNNTHIAHTKCLCGCGADTKTGSIWKPGHDARAAGYLRRIIRGEVRDTDPPAWELIIRLTDSPRVMDSAHFADLTLQAMEVLGDDGPE